MHVEADTWRSDDREDMFARALLLKDRPEPTDPEGDIKSDVEAVSSDTDGSDAHEDPNEYLEDLPAGVRAAELEGGVLPKKDDDTRSAENPSRAAEREARKPHRGDRLPKRAQRASSRPEGPSRGSGNVPLGEVAKRSRGRSAGANDSAMHIRQESPFASFSEQAGTKDSMQAQGSRAVMESKSQLERLERMSSDTIDARQPKSDLPLMRHSPAGSPKGQEKGSSAVQDSDTASNPDALASASKNKGIVKEYRDSLGPMGILGPGDDREVPPPPQPNDKKAEQDSKSGNSEAHANSSPAVAAASDPRAGSLHTRASTKGKGDMDRKKSVTQARNKRLDGNRRSSTSSAGSRAFSRRMSEFAERQPSSEEQSLSATCEAVQQVGPAGSSSQRS